MVASFEALSAARQAQVGAAVIALERAERPLPPTSLPALAEASLRQVVEEVLAAAGRVLVSSTDGFISGYDDGIAERLAQEGFGLLEPIDRAILAFVLLLSVAAPRAAGELPPEASWTTGQPVPRSRFKGSALQGVDTESAIRRLRDAGLLRTVPGKGFVLGYQFHRLTKNASTHLFEELVLLVEPSGSLAESIKRRRAAIKEKLEREGSSS